MNRLPDDAVESENGPQVLEESEVTQKLRPPVQAEAEAVDLILDILEGVSINSASRVLDTVVSHFREAGAALQEKAKAGK